MTVLSKTRAAFAVLFFFAIVCGSAWNIHAQRDALLGGLAGISFPRSPEEVRDVCASLRSLVAWNVTGKYAAWESHASIQRILGKSEMNDFSVVKGPDGRLYRGGLYPLNLENAGELAEAVAVFARAAEKKGAKVLYLNTPDPVAKGAANLPAHMPYRDYNVAQDAFLYTLREKGVPALDARYSLLERNFPPEEIAPKTAFLLHGKSAFTVFSALVDGMERQFGASLDPDGFYRDPANYAFARHPEFFMGELGKETGPAFGGLDDFTAVSPAFATQFRYEAMDMFGNFVKTEGGAAQTFLNADALDANALNANVRAHRENLYRFYPQSYYRHTNTAWSKIVNTQKPNGPKVLVIHDFYAAQIISHLAPLCGEVHTIARHENFPVNAAQYLRANDFDYVIISFFSQNLLRPDMLPLLADAEE